MKFKVLSYREEQQLNTVERHTYYEMLREYAISRKLTNTTPGATTVAPKLKGITGIICNNVCKFLAGGDCEIVVDGVENIQEDAVLFASTHQGLLDGFVWIPDCPKHSLIFHGIVKNTMLLLAQINTGLILVTKERGNHVHRLNAKLDAISVLLNGHSVFICPEVTWNLSPNKLHLPCNFWFVDIAQKANRPIVPVVMEYTYDTTSKKERITRIHIRYGESIWVSEQDKLMDKLEEYKEKISTIRWELIEEKGLFSRRNISNMEYVNFIKGNLNNLKMGQIDINREREGIQGSNEEFYKFHHINDVPFNENGELLETEEVRRLKKINRNHGI